MTDKSRQIILRAKELISHGWCKYDGGMEIDGKSCYCISGAIFQASYEIKGKLGKKSARDDEGYDAFMVVSEFVRRTTGFTSAIVYNDADGRTQAEMVALLEAVAAERR